MMKTESEEQDLLRTVNVAIACLRKAAFEDSAPKYAGDGVSGNLLAAAVTLCAQILLARAEIDDYPEYHPAITYLIKMARATRADEPPQHKGAVS